MNITTCLCMCTLFSLYTDLETRIAVIQKLEELFDHKFNDVISEATFESPYLVDPAHYFKDTIKKKFIEEGLPLNSIDDLELFLKSIDYLKYKDFRKNTEILRKELSIFSNVWKDRRSLRHN